ncbi:helix-turn-helix domain-containing protein [Azomonas agilis]
MQADAMRLKAEGLTQREIAQRLGCAQSVVSKALR